jgi:hypothetical protein
MPGVKWRDEATDDAKRVEAWWRRWPDAMPGLPTGTANGVSVIDLDVRPDKDGLAAYRALGLDPADAGLTVRTAGGGLHLYFDHRPGITNRATKDGIDVRGEGGYVIAPGAIGVAGEYRVQDGDLTSARLLGFGDFPTTMLAPEREPATDQPAPGSASIEDMAAALAFIPSDGDRDPWVRNLMALHHGSGGSDAGRALAHGWSATDPRYSWREVESIWRSFGKRTDDLVTVETLFAAARAHGWQAISDDLLDDLPEDDPDSRLDAEALALLGEDPDPWTDLGGLRFYTPDQLAARPPRDYTVKRLIAPGQIGCIFGDPGAGKSVIAPFVGYRVAQGEDVFGLDVKAGPVFYIAGEDFDGMGDRIKALRDTHGTTSNFLTVAATDLFAESVAGKGNVELNKLSQAVRKVKPRLIFIDTLAATMAGVEENDAQAMNRVVHIGRALACEGAAVIFIHHGTKADGSTPRGHSVFNGALDFSIQVKPADQQGIVRGQVRKNRNGPPDLDIAFRIGKRVVGQYVDGQEIEAPICEPCPSGAVETAEDRLTKAQSEALGHLIDLLGEERPSVSEEEWRDACVEDRKVSTANKLDSRQKAFRRAMGELRRKGRIDFSGGMVSLPDHHQWETLDDLD